MRLGLTEMRLCLAEMRLDLSEMRLDLAEMRLDLAEMKLDLTEMRLDLAEMRLDLAEMRLDLAVPLDLFLFTLTNSLHSSDPEHRPHRLKQFIVWVEMFVMLRKLIQFEFLLITTKV